MLVICFQAAICFKKSFQTLLTAKAAFKVVAYSPQCSEGEASFISRTHLYHKYTIRIFFNLTLHHTASTCFLCIRLHALFRACRSDLHSNKLASPAAWRSCWRDFDHANPQLSLQVAVPHCQCWLCHQGSQAAWPRALTITRSIKDMEISLIKKNTKKKKHWSTALRC